MKRLSAAVVRAVLSILIAVHSLGCGKKLTPEEELESARSRLWPEGTVDESGALIVRWPKVVTHINGVTELRAEAVEIRIPTMYRPTTSVKKPVDKPVVSQIALQIELKDLTPWNELPPLPPEVADGPRLYSSLNPVFGKPTKSIEDPEVRRDVEAWRQRVRTYKRVRLNRDISYLNAAARQHRSTFMKTLQLEPIQRTSHYTYVTDGEVGGLLRYSNMTCVDPARQNDLESEQFLALKLSDDPSPAGCRVIRNNAILFSRPDVPLDDWVFIECDAPLLRCTAHLQGAKRGVEVDFWSHDLPRWRETVDQVRRTVNGFVIN